MDPIDRTKYMDDGEVRRLRASAENRAIADLEKGRTGGVIAWLVVDMALSTGLRVNELARLKVSDIEFKRRSLRVKRTKRRVPKIETLAISKALAKHLKAYLAWRHDDRDELFIGQRGPMTTRGLQQCWLGAVRRAGLPKELSIHSARHTMATHLLKKTRNLRQVQLQLGHASPVVTANLYAQVAFDDMQAGVEGLYE